MKKICLYVIILVCLVFIIPLVFTKVSIESISLAKEQGQNIVSDINNVNEKYNYGNYSKIKLLHSKTNSVEEIELDEYLYGVVCAEMPADFEIEALKAQAIVARTYTIYKIIQNEAKHIDADICDDSNCCQAWITKEERFARWEEDKSEGNWNKIVLAVNDTKGKVITYEGKPINAFFHSNSGGTTEAPIDVWGGSRFSIFTSSSNIR